VKSNPESVVLGEFEKL